MRHRVDLAVRSIERGHDERATAQGLGLADGRDGNVDALAGLGKGGEFGRDQHGGGVLEAGRDACWQLHAEAACGALHRLRQIFEVVIARASETDHDAVAGELVGAHALKLAQIAHAFGQWRGGQEGREA